MNWKRLYTLSTPEERLKAVIQMMQTIETRQQKIILAGSRLIHDRRGPYPGAHFIRDRRASLSTRMFRQWQSKGAMAFIIATLASTTTVITLGAPDPRLGVTLAAFLGSIISLSITVRASVRVLVAR